MCQLCTTSQLFQRFTAITLSILRVFSNFVPFRNSFSVSPPSLCQFYVFLVFTCHYFVCQVFHILLTPCTNFVPLHNSFSVSPPSLCQFYVFLVFTCHNFVMFFYILLTSCANFVPFRNSFSVSPPSLCQFYVFLVTLYHFATLSAFHRHHFVNFTCFW